MLISLADLVAAARSAITECSVVDVAEDSGTRPILIDVREPEEHEMGHIPGSVLIPRGLLEFQIHGVVASQKPAADLPDAEQPIILYCGNGGRSALAAQCAHGLGYKNVRSLAGGISAWINAEMPIDTPK